MNLHVHLNYESANINSQRIYKTSKLTIKLRYRINELVVFTHFERRHFVLQICLEHIGSEEETYFKLVFNMYDFRQCKVT